LADALAGVLHRPDMEAHELTHYPPKMAARKAIVADVGDPLLRQPSPADRQQPVPRLDRDPRIDPVCYDIVERLALKRKVEDVGETDRDS
jgi:hypothetical protein